MKLSLGPLELRFHSGGNWTNLDVAFVSARKGGMAQREEALRLGFKSETAIEVFGQESTKNAYMAPDGTVYFGKTVTGIDGQDHHLTGEQVYVRRSRQEALNQVERAIANNDQGSQAPAAAAA